MHKGARDDPFLSFAKFRKFLFSSTTLVSLFFFFSSVRVHKYINPMGRLCYGPTLLCAEWFWLFILSIYLILLYFLCVIIIKNKYLYTFIDMFLFR